MIRIVTGNQYEWNSSANVFGRAVVGRDEHFLAEAVSQGDPATAEGNDDRAGSSCFDNLYSCSGGESHVSQSLLDLFPTQQSLNNYFLSGKHKRQRNTRPSLFSALSTNAVELHFMMQQGKISILGDLSLQCFNLSIVELLNPTAVGAY